MNTEEWFIEVNKLPPVLTEEETQELFKKMQEGSTYAREKLIIHNIRLVIYEVAHKFMTVECDKKDLVAAGNVGLVNAIDTFDLERNNKFISYATKCIDNEIIRLIRSIQKHHIVSSIDLTLSTSEEGIEFQLSDIINDDNDVVTSYENKERDLIIKEIIMNLPERNREIIMMYFGFLDYDRKYTKREIAKKFNVSPSTAGRIVTNTVEMIRHELERRDLIELNEKNKYNIKFDHKGGYKLNSIYAYFHEYSKEQIDKIIADLSEDEKNLLTLRYGEDLDNPTRSHITTCTRSNFYNHLLPKIKRLLKNTYESTSKF